MIPGYIEFKKFYFKFYKEFRYNCTRKLCVIWKVTLTKVNLFTAISFIHVSHKTGTGILDFIRIAYFLSNCTCTYRYMY